MESNVKNPGEEIKSSMASDGFNIISLDKFGVDYYSLFYDSKFTYTNFNKINSYYNTDGTKKKLKLSLDNWCGVFALFSVISSPAYPFILLGNNFITFFVVVAILFIFYLVRTFYIKNLIPYEYRNFTKQEIIEYFETKNKLDILQAKRGEVHKIYNELKNAEATPLPLPATRPL